VFVFFCLGFAVNRLLYGNWSDKIFHTSTHPFGGRAKSRLSAQRLWDGFTLAQGREHLYHSDLKHEVTPLTDRPMTNHVLAEMQPCVTFIEEQDFWTFEPPHEAGFRWSVVGTEPMNGNVGTASHKITDKGPHGVIERTLNSLEQPWRAVWLNWIDDGLGRRTDQELARLEKRKAAV